MRTFLVLWGTLIVTIIVQMIVYNVFYVTGLFGLSFNVLGNALFSALLALLVWRRRRDNPLSFQTGAGIIAFILSCVAMVLAALYVMPHVLFLGLLMTAPVGAIGSYPTGPDMPLPGGAIAWGLSLFAPIGAGFLVGLLLRWLAYGGLR